jgi:hypothetical protein
VKSVLHGLSGTHSPLQISFVAILDFGGLFIDKGINKVLDLYGQLYDASNELVRTPSMYAPSDGLLPPASAPSSSATPLISVCI